MKIKLLTSALLLSQLAIAQTLGVFNYDFDNLTPGNLNGQDGWVTTKFTNMNLDYKVALTASTDSLTNGITYTGSGANVGISGSRAIDTIFGGTAFNDLNAVYTIKYKLKRNYWGLSFGIAADMNNDGKVDKTNTNEKAVVFTGISNTALGGDKLLLPDGTNTPYTGALTNVWSDVEIEMSNLASGGLLTLRVKPITSSTWTTVVQSAAMGIDTTTASNKNPHNWNMFFMHNEGASGMLDQIQLIKSSTLATSIQDRVAPSLHVYPNPAHEVLHIAATNSNQLHVYTLQGNEVPCKIECTPAGADISTQYLPAGMYVLKVVEQGRVFSKTFVVNN